MSHRARLTKGVRRGFHTVSGPRSLRSPGGRRDQGRETGGHPEGGDWGHGRNRQEQCPPMTRLNPVTLQRTPLSRQISHRGRGREGPLGGWITSTPEPTPPYLRAGEKQGLKVHRKRVQTGSLPDRHTPTKSPRTTSDEDRALGSLTPETGRDERGTQPQERRRRLPSGVDLLRFR